MRCGRILVLFCLLLLLPWQAFSNGPSTDPTTELTSLIVDLEMQIDDLQSLLVIQSAAISTQQQKLEALNASLIEAWNYSKGLELTNEKLRSSIERLKQLQAIYDELSKECVEQLEKSQRRLKTTQAVAIPSVVANIGMVLLLLVLL